MFTLELDSHHAEDVNVIAWGLSLERPTMIKYHIDNIRDLVGHKVHNHVDDQHRGQYHHHQLNMVNISISITISADFNMVIITITAKVDLNMVQSNPLCRLETADTTEERRIAALSNRCLSLLIYIRNTFSQREK